MIKALSAIAVALATLAALTTTTLATLTTTATPAVAAASCSIIVPAKVQISSQFTVITARPGPDCAASGNTDASWNVSPSRSGDFFAFAAGTVNSSYTFYSSWSRVGALRAVGTGATNSGGYLTQNSPTYTVKYTTWAYVSSSRSGRAVRINGLIKNYSNSPAGMVGGTGRPVYLQRCVGGVWHTVLLRTANSKGQLNFGLIQPKAYHYRLIAAETGTSWSARSATTSR
jgi:hypothetical protein